MFGFNHIKLFLLACFSVKSVCNAQKSSVISNQYSDYVNKNPLRIYKYSSQNRNPSYLYYPSSEHFDIVNFPEQISYEKELEVPKLKYLTPKNNELVKVNDFNVQNIETINHPSPFKKPEIPKSSPITVYNKFSKSNDGEVSKLSEQGKKFEDGYHNNHSFKRNKGYNTDLKYNKAKKESYEKKYNSDDGKASKQSNSSKHDDIKKTELDDSQESNEKGEKYNAKKQHKKGSKSKGYHNIFMKDEFKKDRIFYDNSDEKGKYSKYESDHKKYNNNGHQRSRGSHNNSRGKKGSNKRHSSTNKKEVDISDKGNKKESKNHSQNDSNSSFYINKGKSSYNVAIKHAV